MKDQVLEDIKNYAVKRLKEAYGYCVVTGTFRFVKRGQNYGCSLMTVEQPA